MTGLFSPKRFSQKCREATQAAALARLQLAEYIEAQRDCAGSRMAEIEYVRASYAKHGCHPGRAGWPAGGAKTPQQRVNDAMKTRRKKLLSVVVEQPRPRQETLKEAFLLLQGFASHCRFQIELLDAEILESRELSRRRKLRRERNVLLGHLMVMGLQGTLEVKDVEHSYGVKKPKKHSPVWVLGALRELYMKHRDVNLRSRFPADELHDYLEKLGLEWDGQTLPPCVSKDSTGYICMDGAI